MTAPRLPTEAGSVRWGGEPLSFELRSPSATVLANARAVFRPWAVNGTGTPSRCWRIGEAVGAAPGAPATWEVRADGGEPLIRRTLESAVASVESLAVQALFDHASPAIALHAALVARDDDGVILVGPAEGGKSTLASALWQRGWSLIGDDIALVEADGGRARSAPRRVSLRSESRPLLGEALWARISETVSCLPTAEGYLFHPDEVDGRARRPSTRPTALVFLARRGHEAGPARLDPLPAAHAVLALLPYSNVARALDPGEAIRRLRPLAAAAPAFDLGRGPLAAMVGALDDLLTGGGRG